MTVKQNINQNLEIMGKMIKVEITHTLEYTESYVISEEAYNKILAKGNSNQKCSYLIKEQGKYEDAWYGEIDKWREPTIADKD